MVAPLSHWCGLYRQFKSRSLCLDIETAGYGKPITVVGLYQPAEGEIAVTQLVRGQSLTAHHLRQAFASCRLIITFNGIHFDLPRIREEFGEVIPRNIPVLDLYRFARRLSLDTNLKVLEQTLGVERMDARTQRRHVAVKLWCRFVTNGDREALRRLLEYNRQDTINLYPLAEMLEDLAERQEADSPVAD